MLLSGWSMESFLVIIVPADPVYRQHMLKITYVSQTKIVDGQIFDPETNQKLQNKLSLNGLKITEVVFLTNFRTATNQVLILQMKVSDIAQEQSI